MYADGSRVGVFAPTSLLRPIFKGRSGWTPQRGWSAHSTLISGGSAGTFAVQGRALAPSSGPVYSGPSTGSVLAPVECHKLCPKWSKNCQTRVLLSLLAPLGEEGASALPNSEDHDPKRSWLFVCMQPEFSRRLSTGHTAGYCNYK
mgnify:FL=1